MNILESIIRTIGNIYPNAKVINSTIGTILSALVIYKTAYIILGIFFYKKV